MLISRSTTFVSNMITYLEANGGSAGRFAKYSYLSRVSSKSGNVLLNPVQSNALISKTQVCDAFSRDFIRMEESPGTESIVD